MFTEFVVGNGDDLPGRPHDLIGMIAFARFADTAAPLVRAHDALVQFVRGTKIVQFEAEDGTAIGDALALAAARLKRAEEDIARWAEQRQRRRLQDQEQSDHPAHRRAQQRR